MSEADYNKLTISQLKEELESRGLDKTGRKADLVSRLVTHDKASGTEAVEDEEEVEETEEQTTEQAEDMVTLDQVGDGEDAAQPDAATEEALLKDDEPPAEGAAAEGGEGAEAKDADMKDMVVIDEFDALGDEIEVEMARLIDEQIEAARERTKLEEEEKARKEKEEAEKKAAKEAEAAAKKEAKENGEEGDGEKKEGEDEEKKEGEEKPEEEKTEEEKQAEKEKKEKEEKEKKEKERKKHIPRMSYARPPKMADAKLELACDMVKHTVQVQPLSLEQLNHPAIKPFLDEATTYRFMRGWNSERGLTGRLHLIFWDPAKIEEVIKAVEDNQEELGEQCKARSFGGIKTVDIRHTFMRQVVPCTDADIGQLSLLLRRMPIGITTERLREVFPDSTYILLNKEERYALVLFQDKEKFDAVLEKAEDMEIDDAKVDCTQFQPIKKPKPEPKPKKKKVPTATLR